MKRYHECNHAELVAVFAESGAGMHPETACLICRLSPGTRYTVPQMVAFTCSEGRSNPNFKVLETRLNNFIRENAIQPVDVITTRGRPARVYRGRDIQDQMTERNLFMGQIIQDGFEPREVLKNPNHPCFQADRNLPILVHDPTPAASPRAKRRTRFLRRLFLGVLLFGLLLTAGRPFGIWQILKNRGVGDARRAIQSDNAEDPFALYQKAFIENRAGEVEAAEAKAGRLLGMNIPPYLRGDTLYLLGEIFCKTGRFEEARVTFQLSLRLYDVSEKERITRANLGAAKAGLFLGKEREAIDILERIEIRDGYWYLLRGNCHLFQHQYAEALHDTQEAMARFTEDGNNDALPMALIDSALASILLGDLHAAEMLNHRAQEILINTGDQSTYIYAMMNRALIDRLGGKTNSPAEATIEKYLATHPDLWMRKVYRFTQTHSGDHHDNPTHAPADGDDSRR